MVVTGRTLEEALDLRKVPKDFEYGGGTLDAKFAWLHRRTDDTDIYYVANLTDDTQDLQARFRVTGCEAELWHPDTGAIEPASYTEQGDRTIVPLHLEQREMVFVVFPRPAAALSRTLPKPLFVPVATVSDRGK